jgi:ATP-binding cassette subfamily F protein uup
MTTLLAAQAVSKAHGNQTLFDGISFSVFQGDRIGIIGPNGAGKSTLLRCLCGLDVPDEGTITKKQNLVIGYASQFPEFPEASIEEVLLEGSQDVERRTRARILLSKAEFVDRSCSASSLSGGWKKRLDILRALMCEPDLLLLDEPTNHLDIEGIEWLEKLLVKEKTSYMVVSHDRTFLQQVCTSIIELNPCYPDGICMSACRLEEFYAEKEKFLQGQIQQEASLRSTVKEELEWLKKSPKARTTKSRSRVQQAHELHEELIRLSQRNKKTVAAIEFSASERETQKLIACKNICKTVGGKELFHGIDLILSPGTRLGIVGKNGTGKTTLLKIIAGKIAQDMGTIKYADQLRIVYFDQHREHIQPDISLKEALSPHSEYVHFRGQMIHVHGWAKKFLFSSERLQLPVRCLSGGERARILIAKLMLEPADILLLDEPTNDLDIDTLEIIEENLCAFPGSVVLISHDRSLMEHVCNQILALGDHTEQRFFQDFRQWEQAKREQPKRSQESKSVEEKAEVLNQEKKLSYKEQKELAGMEASIERIEQKMEEIGRELELYGANQQKSIELYQMLAAKQKEHEALFERWQYLLNLQDVPSNP